MTEVSRCMIADHHATPQHSRDCISQDSKRGYDDTWWRPLSTVLRVASPSSVVPKIILDPYCVLKPTLASRHVG
jgi:hypothetical protein